MSHKLPSFYKYSLISKFGRILFIFTFLIFSTYSFSQTYEQPSSNPSLQLPNDYNSVDTQHPNYPPQSYPQDIHNQQPAIPPEINKPPEENPDSIFKIKDVYGQVASEYEYEESLHADPAGGAELSDSKISMVLRTVLGWNPIHTKYFLFYAHYLYQQNWGTDPDQISRFFSSWFGKPTAGNFLFPTKALIRNHEFSLDFRYTNSYFESGIYTKYAFKKQGSKLLGEETERATTVTAYENFVPYIALKYENLYKGLFYTPLQTIVNHEDPRLTNASYSITNDGRGQFVSLLTNQIFNISPFRSILYIDGYLLHYKYASIINDYDRMGTAISLDIPVFAGIRAVPEFSWNLDEYFVSKIKIPDVSSSSTDDQASKPYLLQRQDEVLIYGGTVYYIYNKRHRFYFKTLLTSGGSNIPEFKSSSTMISTGYSWSFDTSANVFRRIQPFVEQNYAEEY